MEWNDSGSKAASVWLLDDDVPWAGSLTAHLVRRGFDVSSASSGEEALRVLRVYVRLWFCWIFPRPGASALDILGRIKQIKPDVAVLMLSSATRSRHHLQRLQAGRRRLPEQAFRSQRSRPSHQQILEKQRSSGEVPQLRDQVRRNRDFAGLFGTSPRWKK